MTKLAFSAPSHSSTAAPTLPLSVAGGGIQPEAAPLAFETEGEDTALLGHNDGAVNDSVEAAEAMPLWVLPLLIAAVRPPNHAARQPRRICLATWQGSASLTATNCKG